MVTYLYPALFALFIWWFSTGAIIYLDGLAIDTFVYSMFGATVVFLAALHGLAVTSHDATTHGAYMAFTWGVLAWGWQEISFYMGFVTGPRVAPCPEGCSGWKHFGHAIQTSLWHELAIIGSALIIFSVTRHAPNQVGTWTFMVLWWMHQSAKLNVFLGVRNLNEEFLPDHLEFLKSFLKKKPMNLLFPVSITVSTVIGVLMAQAAMAPGASRFTQVGCTFVATMMALAILEHWFLVLPLPAAKLWSWGLASRTAKKPFDVQVVAGFLGAGKTTFLRRMLAQPAADAGRTIVLVNDFAAVGVDGSLLAGHGADVVELPNGCICCSLKSDLARQLNDVVARFAPDRVLIEPSGVADLAALLRVLNGPDLAPVVRSIDVTTVLDAGSFQADFGRMRDHLQAQIAPAGRVVINKADLVPPVVLDMVANTVHGIAPFATVVGARFGQLDESAIPAAAHGNIMASQVPGAARNVLPLHQHTQHDPPETKRHAPDYPMPDYPPHDHASPPHGSPDAIHPHAADNDHAAHGHAHNHTQHLPGHDMDHGADGLGMRAWSSNLPHACDADVLQDVLQAVVAGRFGQVERVKGVARAGSGWVRFDVAGGRASMSAFAAGKDEAARVVAIGRAVDEEELGAAFEACAVTGEAA
jgi:putative photosynthetic complex assembly protein 2